MKLKVTIFIRKCKEEPIREEYHNSNENTLEGIQSRLNDIEGQIRKLQDRVMEINKTEWRK